MNVDKATAQKSLKYDSEEMSAGVAVWPAEVQVRTASGWAQCGAPFIDISSLLLLQSLLVRSQI
jgi:hypothetical protein